MLKRSLLTYLFWSSECHDLIHSQVTSYVIVRGGCTKMLGGEKLKFWKTGPGAMCRMESRFSWLASWPGSWCSRPKSWNSGCRSLSPWPVSIFCVRQWLIFSFSVSRPLPRQIFSRVHNRITGMVMMNLHNQSWQGCWYWEKFRMMLFARSGLHITVPVMKGTPKNIFQKSEQSGHFGLVMK